jgi:hypothetical protein
MEIKIKVNEVEGKDVELVESEKYDSISGGCIAGCADIDIDIDFGS